MGCNTCGSKSIQQKTEIIYNGSLLKDIKLKNLIQTKDGAIIKQTPIVKKMTFSEHSSKMRALAENLPDMIDTY